MVVISIETVGTERFIRGFNRISADIKDFREPFEEIAQDFWKMERRIFNAEGTPEKFKPLSPRYAAWKRKHYPGKKIMQLTGRLVESLTAENQAVAQDTVKRIERTEAEFGTRVPYAHRHQMGTHGMPRRKIVQLTEQRKRRWAKIIQEWAIGLVRQDLFAPWGGRFRKKGR